jgi:predicted MPP superfamily phosphohydrolase
MKSIMHKMNNVIIRSFSDLHMEFGVPFRVSPPTPLSREILILAGDITTYGAKNWSKHFSQILKDWGDHPVIFCTGNHEYYGTTNRLKKSMQDVDDELASWLHQNHPNVQFLRNQRTTIEGIQFFGGTCWTDFDQGMIAAKMTAASRMSDFSQICHREGELLQPDHTIEMHNAFVEKLIAWFEDELPGSRVVVTHHSPIHDDMSQYNDSSLQPAFVCTDLQKVIEKYQPTLWIHGHTHECRHTTVGERCTVLSNQRGYPRQGTRGQKNECTDFDVSGLPFIIPDVI